MDGGLGGWIADEAKATEPKRLRHLTDILVRNLSVNGPDALSNRDRFVASTSATTHLNSIAKRPALPPRTSKDDINLHYSSLLRGEGSHGKLKTPRRKRITAETLPEIRDETQTSLSGARKLDSSKGKEKANDKSYAGQPVEHSSASLKDNSLDDQDSEIIFGWMSESPPSLVRSKSKNSIKSESSRLSSGPGQVSKRFFRTSSSRRRTLSEENENNDLPTRRALSEHSLEAADPPLPPAHHVSFQMASDIQPMSTFSSNLQVGSIAASRDRSASRSSAMSFASASSTSTIRQTSNKQSEKEEKKLRQKRYDNVRNRLVRSRLTLSLPEPCDSPDLNETSRPWNSYDPSSSKARSKAFLVSSIHCKSMEPSFSIDRSDLLVSPDNRENVLREDRVTVGIWVEKAYAYSAETEKQEGDWKFLFEWGVSFKALESIGNDPCIFPEHLPHNTLIFKFTTSDEYWTARLPSFTMSEEFNEEDKTHDSRNVSRSFDPGAETEEVSGNVSDPGPIGSVPQQTSTRRFTRNIKQNMRDRERDRALLLRQKLLEKTGIGLKPKEGMDDKLLTSIIETERLLQTMRSEQRDLAARINMTLSHAAFKLERKCGEQGYAVAQQKEDLQLYERALSEVHQEFQAKSENLMARRKRLRDVWRLLDDKEKALDDSQIELAMDRAVLESLQLSLAQRQAYLISELSTIFLIEPVDSGTFLFSICGTALPNSQFFDVRKEHSPTLALYNDDAISSALGYVAQVVHLLAAYLAVPLHYPVRCMGSRSLVHDPISQIKGPKIFPLYAKGVDRFRFEYALFLLNKDIEQIMHECGIGILDLQQTLPNLKNLYLTLSTEASSQMASYNSKSAGGLGLVGHPRSSRQIENLGPAKLHSNDNTGHAQMQNLPQTNAMSKFRLTGIQPEIRFHSGSTAALEKILDASLVIDSGKFDFPAREAANIESKRDFRSGQQMHAGAERHISGS